MNKAFTLIELLAVIAILAIVLLIAVPMVLSTIASSKQGAFKDNAQMVIKAVELKMASDSSFDYRTLTADNIDDLGIDNSNYASLSVTKQSGKIKVTIIGKNSWNGYTAYGTTDAMHVTTAAPDILFADKSGASPPEMSSNMIPIYYDATCNSNAGCWRKADVNNLEGTYEWYDYETKKWANSVTVTNAKRTEYQNAAVGIEIENQYILTYMVWIPRYKYYIDATNKLIYPVFESATITKSTGNATSSSTYLTHPGFTFGSQELSGFWMGKFETSVDTSSTCYTAASVANCNLITLPIRVKYSFTAWRYAQLATFYTAIRNMESTGNVYGYISTEVDTHLTKNSEWAAVAYLSYSTYGKNSEVWPNPNFGYLTGYAGTGVDSASFTTANSYAYNTTNGVNASTTGNVYGIYDMSGCLWEYVMGNYNSNAGYNSSSTSGFSGYNAGDGTTSVGYSFPTSQYYNLYTSSAMSTACNGGICLGQALSETSGWNGDLASFPSASAPWLIRSGTYGNGNGSGLFYYYQISGGSDQWGGTHIVQIET